MDVLATWINGKLTSPSLTSWITARDVWGCCWQEPLIDNLLQNWLLCYCRIVSHLGDKITQYINTVGCVQSTASYFFLSFFRRMYGQE